RRPHSRVYHLSISRVLRKLAHRFANITLIKYKCNMFIKIFYFLFHPNELYVNYKLIIVIYMLQLIQQRNHHKQEMDIVKKIKDERLILQTLKNVRIAFLFQSLGIIGILGYTGFTEGIDQITKSPLWLLFILTSMVLSYLQLSVSIDVEEGEKEIKLTPYYKLVLRSLIVGIVMAIIYIIFSPERPLLEAILTGSILFICFLVSYSISYFIKKRRLQDDDE
ncbi:hypothetical protein P3530_23550, partial [Vibrio parahaemolyticus]|nr:hypothetical protein [Vibrio parahaemolyticus]